MAKRIIKQDACVVYWLFDETCVLPRLHGYVGVTSNLGKRIKQHRASNRFPINFKVIKIFCGYRKRCDRIEIKLRPVMNIGWNIGRGGYHTNLGWKQSTETIAKRSVKLRGQKRTKETIERIRLAGLGKRNCLGYKHTDEARANMSAAHRGYKMPFKQREKIGVKLKGRSKPKGFGVGRKFSEATKAKKQRLFGDFIKKIQVLTEGVHDYGPENCWNGLA